MIGAWEENKLYGETGVPVVVERNWKSELIIDKAALSRVCVKNIAPWNRARICQYN